VTEAAHWDDVYQTRAHDSLSWFQPSADISLALITSVADPAAISVIDVGAGTSPLADALLTAGCRDLTLVDLSETALAATSARLNEPTSVATVVGDITEWDPGRTFDLWHDRAVFHFLSGPGRDRYVATAERSIREGGHLVIGTFADDGPTRCSDRDVSRYSADQLAAAFANGFEMVTTRDEHHLTPKDIDQHFTWVVLRRRDA
jgi:SAM-dependent methyltransferase